MATNWRRILVPIEFADGILDAELRIAQDLAKIHKAKLFLLHVIPMQAGKGADGSMTARFYLEAEESAKEKLADLASGPLKGFKVEAYVEVDDPARAIARCAEEIRADLVVMATHNRRGLKRALLASVAEKLVHTCPCPLLTIRAS